MLSKKVKIIFSIILLLSIVSICIGMTSAIEVNDSNVIEPNNINTTVDSMIVIDTVTTVNDNTNNTNTEYTVNDNTNNTNTEYTVNETIHTSILKEKNKLSSPNVNVVSTQNHNIKSQVTASINIKEFTPKDNNLINACLLPDWLKEIIEFVYGPIG